MKIEQYSRVINHRISTAGQKFTIPTSNDHTDETWLATDLYIGELGVNVSDDTIYFRSNNGIIQISASSSGPSQSQIWVTSGSNIALSSTFSADAVIPNSLYYTDLGTSTTRWKDLYLGGSTTGQSTIEVNGGLSITETANNGILGSGFVVTNNTPIIIFASASVDVRNRPLHLNSKDSYIYSTTGQCATIASDGVIINSGVENYLVSGSDVVIGTNSTNGAHIGKGFLKTNIFDDTVVIGGNLAVRGVADDGTGQYAVSDWTTTQASLRTFDALYNLIADVDFFETGASASEVMQLKAYIIGTEIDNADNVYSAELLGLFKQVGGTASQVGQTITREISNYPGLEAIFDTSSTGVEIKVKGTGTDTIQWLCTYSWHRMKGII